MKKVFYTIVFFILFIAIQQLPNTLKQNSYGFPLSTYKYSFTTDNNKQWSTSITTTHVSRTPYNIFINFAFYTIAVLLVYCYIKKQNVFKFLTNRTTFLTSQLINFVRSKWVRTTFKLLGYSFIIFAIIQFLPYHSAFKNGVSRQIGFPQAAYYVYDAQCYSDSHFELRYLISNFIIITIATFSIYFIIQIITLIYNTIKPLCK